MDEEIITQRSREAVPTIPCRNVSGVEIPAYSIVQITGLSTGGRYDVTKPNANNIVHILASPPYAVKVGANFDAYNIEDGYIAARDAIVAARDGVTAEVWVSGQTLGVQSGQWTLSKDKTGLVCMAVAGGTLTRGRFFSISISTEPFWQFELWAPNPAVSWFCLETEQYGEPAKTSGYYGWNANAVRLTTGNPMTWVSPWQFISPYIQNEGTLRYGMQLVRDIDLQSITLGDWEGKFFLGNTVAQVGYGGGIATTGQVTMSYDLCLDMQGFDVDGEMVEFTSYPFISKSCTFNPPYLGAGGPNTTGGSVGHIWHTQDTGGMNRSHAVITPAMPKGFLFTKYRYRLITACNMTDTSYATPYSWYFIRAGFICQTVLPTCYGQYLCPPTETWARVKYDPDDYYIGD